MLKLDAAAEFPEAAQAIADAGYPVWAQFGITPHTAMRYSGTSKTVPELTEELKDQFVDEARLLQESGASMLDFTNSGPVAGPAVTAAVSIPVLGGLGGGPWLDGRVRAIGNAIGYTAAALDDDVERYANVARITLDAITAYAADVRGGASDQGQQVGVATRIDRRHPDALRSVRLRPAAADVLSRRVRRDGREVDDPGDLRADPSDRASVEALHVHRLRSPRVRRVGWAGRNGVVGGNTSRRARGCSTTCTSAARTSWARAWAVRRRWRLRSRIRLPRSSLLLYWPVGGPQYRISSHARFAEHLEYVRRAGLAAVVSLVQAEGKPFNQDPRGGPWAAVIRRDAAFARSYQARTSIATCRWWRRCATSCSTATPRRAPSRKTCCAWTCPP